MKSFGVVSCFIVLVALVLVSYAERSYPLPAQNQQDVKAQNLGVEKASGGGGWGGWGGWSAATRVQGHPRIATLCMVSVIGWLVTDSMMDERRGYK
ncbi:hypothetical protein R6Q59_023595 [Mikania micrantha]